MNLFKELYQYRELLKTNIKKEFRGKYKKSSLGVLWSFINPLLQLLVYALVFPFILRVNVEHYTTFMIVALIPWNFFATVVGNAAPIIVNNANIVKKVYFPRIILPISTVTSGLVNFLISCILIICALFISGVGFSIYILYLPLIILIQYLLTLGISFILSSITVYLRDLEYVINAIMMLWFYLTPVLYDSSLIPTKFQFIYNLNPMTPIINSYRDVLYYHVSPPLMTILILGIVVVLILILGYFIFKKCEKNFAEEI